MLVDRIDDHENVLLEAWRSILDNTCARGELFTLQLHPERIRYCEESLIAVLKEARQRTPPVWIATLREIDEWWRKRLENSIAVSGDGNGRFSVSIECAEDVAILVKGLPADGTGVPYWDGYNIVAQKEFSLQAPSFPGIGLSDKLHEKWYEFLRQQGYLIEVSEDGKDYACRLDKEAYNELTQLEMINLIEGTQVPFLRVGLWPKGFYSALSVTGDLDALSIWDYLMRLVGK
jgi:hypothetical protein